MDVYALGIMIHSTLWIALRLFIRLGEEGAFGPKMQARMLMPHH